MSAPLAPNDLLQRRIRWKETGRGRWEATVDLVRCFLKMNDSPGEALYTVTVDGQPLDFDDPPKSWLLESKTGR